MVGHLRRSCDVYSRLPPQIGLVVEPFPVDMGIVLHAFPGLRTRGAMKGDSGASPVFLIASHPLFNLLSHSFSPSNKHMQT
jgi:hypothetical protein